MDVDYAKLAAFAAVARHRNFRKAAAARGVSPSTLSLSVRTLESDLGLRLFNRSTRSVALTEAGAKLLERLDPALSDIAAALDEVTNEAGELAGTIRINGPEPAIELVLAPLVCEFLEAHPKVTLEVVAESGLIDIVKAGFDFGVRWGESLAQDMIALPLGPPQRFAIVGSPSLFERFGRPEAPRDVLRFPCIRVRFASGMVPAWEFERGETLLRIDPPGRLVTTSIPLQRHAALSGVGLWAAFEEHVADDIAAGRLVSVLEDWCASFPGPFLYYPSRHNLRPAVRAFIDMVRSRRTSR